MGMLELAKQPEVKFHKEHFPLSLCLSGEIQALFLEFVFQAPWFWAG